MHGLPLLGVVVTTITCGLAALLGLWPVLWETRKFHTSVIATLRSSGRLEDDDDRLPCQFCGMGCVWMTTFSHLLHRLFCWLREECVVTTWNFVEWANVRRVPHLRSGVDALLSLSL